MSDQQVFDTITALDEERLRLTVAGDIDAVEKTIGSSLRYVHGSATDEDRALYLERLRNGYYDYKSLENLRREFRRFGDTVLVHGDLKIHVVANGNERSFTSRYLQVWAKEGGQWKFVSWQTTMIPA
ncbi:MAG: nuclear transport factor 2 family protein [Burkholderiaceae bacterium]|nr:nuclear transport factor 2 family protein [Burkholderiaceae bacterium]